MTRPAREVPVRAARSMLFVPATRWAMIEKAAVSAADAVCLDLEDSLTVDEKDAGRANVIRAFREIDFGRRTKLFRMNAVDTPQAARDLGEVLDGAAARVDLVMVPKVSGADDVAFVDNAIARSGHTIGIEAQIETAEGFVWMREIAFASPRLEALIFGPGDYAASMRMPSTSIGALDEYDDAYPGHRWHAPMHAIVAHARAAGLRAIDGPYAAFKDAEGFRRSCSIARGLGFDGKQCIHPSQLAIANEVFSPSEREVADAERMVRAVDDAAAAGLGAATLDGKMIDAASLRMARSVLTHRDTFTTGQ